LAKRWSNPLKVVTTWIINKLLVRTQDREACRDAALREKDQIGTKRLSPQEAADIVLELRDIVVALDYGSQLNIPTVGAAIESTLSDFVKMQVTNWSTSRSKNKRARLGQLPENYSEANLKKLVEKAQEFYVATAVTSHTRSANPRDFISRIRTRSPAAVRSVHCTPCQEEPSDRTGGDPLSDPDDVDGIVYEYEEAVQHSHEMAQHEHVHALQGGSAWRQGPSKSPPPVGRTGPSTAQKYVWQQGQGRTPPWKNKAQQGFPGPAHVKRSGDGSAFPAVGLNAILGADDYDGCWWCLSKEHYQRDCPLPGASTAPRRPRQGPADPRRVARNNVLHSLQGVTQMHDIVHNPPLALLVAIQGVSPELQSQLPQEAVAAIRQYEESSYADVCCQQAEETAEYRNQS